MKTTTRRLLAVAALGLSASSAHAALVCTELGDSFVDVRGINKCVSDNISAVLYRWDATQGLLDAGDAAPVGEDPRKPIQVAAAPWEALAYCANRLPSNRQESKVGTVNVFYPLYTERTIDNETGAMFIYEPFDTTQLRCSSNALVQFADSEEPGWDGVERDSAWGWVGSGAGIVETGWNGLGGGDPWAWVVPWEDSVIGWWSWDTANDGTGDDWLYGENDW